MSKFDIKLSIQWYKDHMEWMNECTSGDFLGTINKCIKIDKTYYFPNRRLLLNSIAKTFITLNGNQLIAKQVVRALINKV